MEHISLLGGSLSFIDQPTQRDIFFDLFLPDTLRRSYILKSLNTKVVSCKDHLKKNHLKSAENGYTDTFVCLVAWPSNESEAGGDHALIQTFLLFLILMLISRNLRKKN